jgi:hypothetical protein
MAAGADEKSPAEHSSWYFCSLLHRKTSDRSRHQHRELLSHHRVCSSCCKFSETQITAYWVKRPRRFRGACYRVEGITYRVAMKCLVQVGLVGPLEATVFHLYPPVLYIFFCIFYVSWHLDLFSHFLKFRSENGRSVTSTLSQFLFPCTKIYAICFFRVSDFPSPCHGSGRLLQASRRWRRGSNLGHSVCGLWWTKLTLGHVSLPVLRRYPVTIIPPMLHTRSFNYQS